MRELIRTNDLVILSLVRAVLEGNGMFMLVADEAISSIEGSIGAFPRRVLVHTEDLNQARRLLVDAGIEAGMLSGGAP